MFSTFAIIIYSFPAFSSKEMYLSFLKVEDCEGSSLEIHVQRGITMKKIFQNNWSGHTDVSS